MRAYVHHFGYLTIIFSLIFLAGYASFGDRIEDPFSVLTLPENDTANEIVPPGDYVTISNPSPSGNTTGEPDGIPLEVQDTPPTLETLLAANRIIPRDGMGNEPNNPSLLSGNAGGEPEEDLPKVQNASYAPSETVILNEGNLQGAAGSQYWVITNPGSYFVNLASGQLVTSNRIAILILASNVILDGNNVLIDNSGSLSGSYGIWVQNGHYTNVTIKNFRVTDFEYAVEMESVVSGHLESITLERNNVGIWVFDSDGIIIEGCHAHDRNNYGIFLIQSINCIVRNNEIHNNMEGLYLIESDNNQVYSNNASYNDLTGIYLGYESQTDNNEVYGNIARYNDMGILLDRYCDNNSVYSNQAQFNRRSGIMLVMDSQNRVHDNTVTDNDDIGIFLYTDNDHNEINDNDVQRNKYGIAVAVTGYDNDILRNIVSFNTNYGIWLSENCTFTNVTSNTITSNNYGIMVYDSGSNQMDNNTITNCPAAGIYLDRTRGNNEIRRNTIRTNGAGIYLYTSGNEMIFNNYLNNTKNVGLAAINTRSTWNTTITPGRNIIDGPYLAGNYYATPGNTGFSQVTPDSDRNGICDFPYSIPTDDLAPTVNIDYLPLHEYQYNQTNVGIFRNGMWVLDYNGNFAWDGPGSDRIGNLGQAGDTVVVGDWDGNGKDEIGIFRNGLWVLDYNGNLQWDGTEIDRIAWLGQTGDDVVYGDWNGDGADEIGIFRNGLWVLDYNGNFVWDGPESDRIGNLGQAGDTVVVGDWDGNGKDKIGIFRDGLWALDQNGNFVWDGPPVDIVFSLGMHGDIPVTGRFG